MTFLPFEHQNIAMDDEALISSPHVYPGCSPTNLNGPSDWSVCVTAVAALGDLEEQLDLHCRCEERCFQTGRMRAAWGVAASAAAASHMLLLRAPTGIWDNFSGCRGDDCWQWCRLTAPCFYCEGPNVVCWKHVLLGGCWTVYWREQWQTCRPVLNRRSRQINSVVHWFGTRQHNPITIFTATRSCSAAIFFNGAWWNILTEELFLGCLSNWWNNEAGEEN